jgi:hypothetical protein
MLPTVSSIKKRLARQGSKFAGSDAFRVYKFTDGAWSDIILGAVMGAARRSDALRRINPQPANAVVANLPAEAANDMTRPANDTLAAVLTTPRRDAARPPVSPPQSTFASEPPMPVDPEHVSRFGPYAQSYQPQNHQPMPPRFAHAPQSPRVPRPAPPPPPEAEVTVKVAANGNTGPAFTRLADALAQAGHTETGSTNDTSVVVNLPWAQPDAAVKPAADKTGMVDVTLKREPATFSVPVSEANVPDGLRQVFARAGHGAALAVAAVPEQIELTFQDHGEDAHEDIGDLDDGLGSNDEDFTEHDLKLIGRMAPPAAE